MTTKRTGNKRLLELAEMLERVPKAKVIKQDNRGQGLKKRGYYQGWYIHPCGSPACAWGHWFLNNEAAQKRITRKQKRARDYVDVMWFGEGYVPFVYPSDAAGEEFAINHNEMDLIFGGWGCNNAQTGKQAAAYIREFVKNRGDK